MSLPEAWTPYEDRRLREAAWSGLHGLAEELGRSPEALRRRFRRLTGAGIRPRNSFGTDRSPMAPEWADLFRRLIQAHGQDRAEAIFAGRDHAFNTDLQAWRAIGGFR